MKLPQECLTCKKDQCPLHCMHLGPKLKAEGKDATMSGNKGDGKDGMRGTF